MTSNERSFPWDDHNGDREYSSDEFAEFFSTLFKPGIVATANFGSGLQITESASLGMRVKFGAGEAFSSFGRNYVHDKDEEVTVPIASTLQDRTDSVAIQFNKSQREAFFVYKESDVTVTRTDSIFELQIAKILVPKNSTQITNTNIKDMRANESVCGYFSPHGKLNAGDITAQYKGIFTQADQDFQKWFEDVKGQLSEDAAGHLQNQLDSLDSKVYTAYANSADGTDGFTTTYPNLNLLEGSKKYTKNNPLIVSSSAADGANPVNDVVVKNLKAGTYTLSAKADASWVGHGWNQRDKEGHVGLWLISEETWEWINLDTVPKTIEVHKDGNYLVRVNTYSNGKDIVTHKFWDFKLEPGSTATPYMPSSSEVTTADYPQYKYVGHMAGLNVADKSDPKNYMWQSNTDIVRDQNGTALVKDLEVSGKLELPTATLTVTTKSGLVLILNKRGDFAEVSFSGEVSNVTPGKMIPGTWVDNPFHPTTTKQLIGHFAGRDTSFHIDLKPDGSMIWWGAAIGTASLTARGTSTYLLN
ncbi:MAG: hypothetical protein ACTH21_08890 [Lactococcus lactis]